MSPDRHGTGLVVGMLVLAIALAARADEPSAPAPIPLLVDPFVGESPARVAGGADGVWQEDASVGARASVEGAVASRVAARVSFGLPVAGELESDVGGEARVLFAKQEGKFPIDGALGVRYTKVGFDGVDNELEGVVALARQSGKHRVIVTAAWACRGRGPRGPERRLRQRY